MPSQKPSMIDALRSKHDPHYQLAGKVGGLEKGLSIQVAQLHKTMSKSFGMQRKTLARVLGLEKRLSELEIAIEIWTTREGLRRQQEEERRKQEEEAAKLEEDIDVLLDDIRNDEEVGGTKTKTKPKSKPKARRKPKPRVRRSRVTGRGIGKNESFAGGSRPKIDADKFRRGTSQETAEERLQRQARNREESAAGEEHKKTNEYKETATGTDEKGEYLSAAERKRRFKAAKFIPPGSSSTTPSDIKPDGEGDKKTDVITFLNGEVAGKLDTIKGDVSEIKDSIVDGNDLAEEKDEDVRQALLEGKKKKREKDLEDKPDTPQNKMLESVTKPVGNFLNKLIKFVTMTFVGSVVNNVLTLLKDPARLLDPIKRFFNLVIGLVNAVMKGLWNVTGAPMNFIIGGINSGVESLLGAINKATGLLKIPPIPAPKIPMIPGPPNFDFIPLSKTAQEANQAVGMAGGGLVPGYEGGGGPGISDGSSSMSTEDLVAAVAPSLQHFMEQNNEMIDSSPGAIYGEHMRMELDRDGKMVNFGKTVANMSEWAFNQSVETVQNNELMEPEVKEAVLKKMAWIRKGTLDDPNFKSDLAFDINKDIPGTAAHRLYKNAQENPTGIAAKAGFSPEQIAKLQNRRKMNKGGKVPGTGTGDTVPAMLTPGEFVMSKGAVDQIGADKLMAMNKAGGGTNKPKMMKFAGGGIVPGVDAPSGRGGNVVVIGGGGGSSAPRGVSPSGSSGENRRFSSTDPNNMTIPVVKSLYNIMS